MKTEKIIKGKLINGAECGLHTFDMVLENISNRPDLKDKIPFKTWLPIIEWLKTNKFMGRYVEIKIKEITKKEAEKGRVKL